MKFKDIELPSNKKFGFFFTSIFAIIAIYLHSKDSSFAYFFISMCIIFFIISLTRANILNPLNLAWMRFGYILGLIISPIILGIIFYGIFTPLAFFFRIIQRDELELKLKNKSTYWKIKKENFQSPSFFKNQF